jgi:hypothetical protein
VPRLIYGKRIKPYPHAGTTGKTRLTSLFPVGDIVREGPVVGWRWVS